MWAEREGGDLRLQDLGWGAKVSQNLGHQRIPACLKDLERCRLGGVPEGKGEQWQHLSRGWMLPGTLATCVGGNRRHPRPTWQAKASRAAKASDLREENWNVFFFFFCSLISDRVPSSLVRMGVSRLKAGSFLKMPSLHLL